MYRSDIRLGRTALAGILFATSLYGCSNANEPTTAVQSAALLGGESAQPKVAALSTPAATKPKTVAEPVTAERLKSLPAAEQARWQSYLERSATAARADLAALDAELAANDMAKAIQAPNGGDFKLPAEAGDAYYAGEEAKQLADTILSYQTPSGGWSKHTGYARGPRKKGMQWSSQSKPGEKPHYLATFDNRSTTEQLYFLANVWHATKREDCKEGFVRGLNYILDAQFPNGGWPQVYPLEGGYHDHITFNDDAMTHIMRLLKNVNSGEPYFGFLTEAQKAKANAALETGLRCVLQLQVEQQGKKTVWCAQYDPLTLKPSQARLMEPATLSGAESARILDLLMSFNAPSAEVKNSIESGLAWFEVSKLPPAPTTEVAATDAKPKSGDRWARFYDLNTGKPVFPGRDGVQYETFEAMAENNRLGYDYFSTKPGSILNTGQKKWRKMLAKNAKKS